MESEVKLSNTTSGYTDLEKNSILQTILFDDSIHFFLLFLFFCASLSLPFFSTTLTLVTETQHRMSEGIHFPWLLDTYVKLKDTSFPQTPM